MANMTDEEYDSLFENGVSEEDRKKLEQALELVRSTVVYQVYGKEDPDWHICNVEWGLTETLEGNWWQR